ncbi:MAG TPA: inositol-3-phosphate synthase [Candidatus Polarisedimenticolia bacterium]|nr:inositol-3-phosphate synthase [Candidatus Polarisedimenticolia bacterium]
MNLEPARPTPASGRLGVLAVGGGALSTTLIAGVLAVRRGLGKPVGSLTQMGRVSGPRAHPDPVPLGQAVPLASLQDLVFGVWDILPDSVYSAAEKAKVLDSDLLRPLREELEAIRPWPGIFDPRYVRRIEATHCRPHMGHLASIAEIEKDIQSFRESAGLNRMVLINTASTEVYHAIADIHGDLRLFERALAKDDERITPSMLYAYAALKRRIPVINCTPSHAVDIPALLQMSEEMKVPVAGRDLKTGQTLLKTILAPGLKARALGLAGWYSTNILGNRDGQVLDDPECLKTKEESKLSVLKGILEPDLYPELYGDLVHRVRIDYYPPRKDNKEAWDNIDIFGWLGYPMQIKINFLCRDSILAAPLALDLVLLADLASRAGLRGAQDWLSLYFKNPTVRNGRPIHDLQAQHRVWEDEVRRLAGWRGNGRHESA